jgi:hypothetical protein
MKDVIELNRKGPRHRAKRYNMASPENIKAIADHPDCLVKDPAAVKRVIMAVHHGIRDTIINTRDGIELPEQLGYMFLGTCQPKIRKNVDFKTSNHYLKVIQHRNWESDNYLAKIFYTNYETKYKFKYNELWGFKAAREFTKMVGQEYPKKWKMYIQVDHTLKIARLYRDYIRKTNRQEEDDILAEDYNPLEID